MLRVAPISRRRFLTTPRPPAHSVSPTASRGLLSAARPTGRASPTGFSPATRRSTPAWCGRAPTGRRAYLRYRDQRQLQERDPLGVARRAARKRLCREGADRRPAAGPGHLLSRRCDGPVRHRGRRRADHRPLPHRAGRPPLDLVRLVRRHRRPGLGHRRVARRHADLRDHARGCGPTSSSTPATRSMPTARSRPRRRCRTAASGRTSSPRRSPRSPRRSTSSARNYKYNLLDRNLRAFNAEVPMLAQWDDHEVTNNWSPSKSLMEDKRYSEKSVPLLSARAARAFHEFMPIRATPQEAARVYRKVAYGPLLDIFFLDMRTYRGPNTDNTQSASGPGDACSSAATQLAWLKRELDRLARDLEGDRRRHAARRSSSTTMPPPRRARRRSRRATAGARARARIRRALGLHQARRHPQHRLAHRRRALYGGALLRSRTRRCSRTSSRSGNSSPGRCMPARSARARSTTRSGRSCAS